MEDLIRAFLEKGFLLEPALQEILKEVNPQVVNELVEAITSSIKEKIISKDNFTSNLSKINLLFETKLKEGPSKKEGTGEALDLLSSMKESKRQLKQELEIKKPEEDQEKADKADKEGVGEQKLGYNKSILFEGEIKDTKKEMKVDEAPPEIVKETIEGSNIIKSYLIPPRKINVEDFTKHFKNRFNVLKGILQKKNDLEDLTSISKISREKQRLSIIGMVFDKRITKKKNLLLKLEDSTGQILAVVNHNREDLFKQAEDILLDDVLGFRCSGSSDILFVEEIIFPDISIKKKVIEKEEYAVFTSDLHIGSNNFLEKEFLNFIDWINLKSGSEQQKEIAKKVKYLFIVGDSVDGVGIFPGQENFLVIKDVKEQYEKLASLLKQIRKDITIFLSPGQHDAVRLAEPQPPVGYAYAPSLYNLENLFLVSNPALINIGKTKISPGLKILMYHGASFHNIINEINSLRIGNAHDTPTKIVKTLLKRRHLAPTHSFTVYLPSTQDPLLIQEAPDIVLTGDLHRAEISSYNNILLVASSCWQSKTSFEEKVGNHPSPCKVPILNLKTGGIKIIDFS